MGASILLVDDHRLLRQGLRQLLGLHFTIAGEAGDGRTALAEALRTRPDIVLMDIQLRGASSLETVVLIKQALPGVRVVVLTAMDSQGHLQHALRAGADGYVLKDAPVDELMLALRRAVEGRKFVGHALSAYLVDGFVRGDAQAQADTPLTRLTERERSILQLVAEGRTNRAAAQLLHLSPKTVEKHRARLMQKLGLSSAAELTLVALELGLVQRSGAVSRLLDAP